MIPSILDEAMKSIRTLETTLRDMPEFQTILNAAPTETQYSFQCGHTSVFEVIEDVSDAHFEEFLRQIPVAPGFVK